MKIYTVWVSVGSDHYTRNIAHYTNEEMALLHYSKLRNDHKNWLSRIRRKPQSILINDRTPHNEVVSIFGKDAFYKSAYDDELWSPKYHESYCMTVRKVRIDTIYDHLDQYLGHYGD